MINMDKKIFKVSSLHEKDEDKFWTNKTYLDRIEALEELRKTIFGYDPSTARLQRTITVTKLKKD